MDKGRTSVVTTRFPENRQLPPASAANVFHMAAANGEIQLLVGAINLLDLVNVEGDVTLDVNVSHRFLLSPVAWERLKNAVSEMTAKLELTTQTNTGEHHADD
jgi:hypothetical protein